MFQNQLSSHLFAILILIFMVTAACQSTVATQAILPSSPSPSLLLTSTVTPPTLASQPTPYLGSATPTITVEVTRTSTPSSPPQITLLFTGQIVPGRCVQTGVEAKGNADYIYDNVRDLISSADYAIGTFNGTLSDSTPKTGCIRTFILVGSPEQADAMKRAGFDAMSVATNHIKNCVLSNCGDRAFWETIENLRRVGITPVGAGRNLAEAMQPVVFTVQGVRFAVVSLGEIEPMAFASQEKPGIAVLNEDNLRAAILAARQVGDVVIVMPHWGPEYSAAPNWNQRKYAKIAVEAGADLVVGNHPHTVQAIQMINKVPVFYGLGNFVFDQSWSVEVSGSVILQVTFEGTHYKGYTLTPAISKMDGMVLLANKEQAAQILGTIEKASQELH